MHFRRNNRRISLDVSSEHFVVEPVRGPMLIIAAVLLAAGVAAVVIAMQMDRHGEPLWALAVVWALVAVIFGVLALWPAPRLRVELARRLLDLDGATHSLDQATFTHDLLVRYAGRRRIESWVVSLSVPGRSVKLVELGEKEGDLANNLVAGLQQFQRDQRAEGLETLKEAIEYATPAAGKEVLMVIALIVLPIFVFWIKGAF